ncbi:hypothetical protein [Sulfurovum sp. TSL6]|uniref:hypothetical protein n=1 Tax=Sulfurovum sp. TSL6 TaxID=2826995 RepID=UPI001CC7D0A8|nr:hypothetical protein [Sulfurovum sp. TSL6]
MEMNTILIVLLIIMLILQSGAIYLLLIRKRFKITSESATQDIERFLNSLDEEISERSLSTDKYLLKLAESLEKHDTSRINMMYEIKTGNQEVINNITQDVNTSQNEVKKIVSLLNEMLKTHLDDVANKIGTMQEEVRAVKELALEKEEKIRRYEEGYDQRNIKQFYKELFKILESIKKERQTNDNEVIEDIQDDLLLLLENNGIEKIEIVEGTSYEGLSKVAKVIDTEETDDPDKDLLIKEVKKDGYFVQVDEEVQRVIRPAEVILYKFNQVKEGE